MTHVEGYLNFDYVISVNNIANIFESKILFIKEKLHDFSKDMKKGLHKQYSKDKITIEGTIGNCYEIGGIIDYEYEEFYLFDDKTIKVKYFVEAENYYKNKCFETSVAKLTVSIMFLNDCRAQISDIYIISLEDFNKLDKLFFKGMSRMYCDMLEMNRDKEEKKIFVIEVEHKTSGYFVFSNISKVVVVAKQVSDAILKALDKVPSFEEYDLRISCIPIECNAIKTIRL